MKGLLIVILAMSFTLFSANIYKTMEEPRYSDDKYEKQWKEVKKLADEGLYKSALEKVERIYLTSKKENNPSQVVKSVIHRLTYKSFIEENTNVTGIYGLQKEVESAGPAEKPILQSMLAEMYWNYYQQNRYRFYNRTTTANVLDDDIQTWDLQKLLSAVTNSYEASLSDPKYLKSVSLDNYDEILVGDKRIRNLRPTLFDLLGHRAVDFYINEEAGLPEPSYSFELAGDQIF